MPPQCGLAPTFRKLNFRPAASIREQSDTLEAQFCFTSVVAIVGPCEPAYATSNAVQQLFSKFRFRDVQSLFARALFRQTFSKTCTEVHAIPRRISSRHPNSALAVHAFANEAAIAVARQYDRVKKQNGVFKSCICNLSIMNIFVLFRIEHIF